ncbi:DUF2946 family protein [Castellaniella sp.]|uniref:DUF2946 family protein n=1 Tax=Castellaniella sp. TaxID=1955812 RepID=UPI002AFE61AD|nr:DUF2946 family protein [Castellaniella sp.]
MDDLVHAAMARWPDVPAAYGWLSLSRRGQWRLHPHGGGWGTDTPEPGESITSPQILGFIGRNYQTDDSGCWFFQNGPQRVYVRLDGAPWILHTQPGPDTQLQLGTHTGQAYGPPSHWWLTHSGLLYAQSAQGAGLVQDHDLAQLLDHLRLADGRTLGDSLDGLSADQHTMISLAGHDAPLGWLDDNAVADMLGFVRFPVF